MKPTKPIRRILASLPCMAVVLICLLTIGLMQVQAGEDRQEIQLKDGTTFSGKVFSRSHESVIVGVRREDVRTIDGQVLPPPVQTGSVAPSFEVMDLNGVHYAVPDGSPATLVAFWATWCPHCRADLPLMKELYAKYHDRGFRLLAISVDQDLKKLQDFVPAQQLPYPVIPSQGDHLLSGQAGLSERFEAGGVPSYFLIDGKGSIVQTFSGSIIEGKGDLEGALQRLLPASATKSAKNAS